MIRCASRAIPLVACLILLAGCQDSANVLQPRSFDRPQDVTFACLAVGRSPARFVSLDVCAGREMPPEEAELHQIALVTQTGRGEVAAVDLTEGLVIDADVRVPGFTFVRVSEAPSGIVVHPDRPELTYVASFGARRLEAIETARFDPRVTAADGTTEPPPLALPAAPTDLALAPSGDALYMPLPAAGAIYRVPLDEDGAFVTGEAEMIALPGAAEEPAPVDLTAIDVPATAQPGMYEKACLRQDAEEGDTELYDIPDPPVEPPRAPVSEGDAPRPVTLRFDPDPVRAGIVDADEPVRLFVADEARPVVHVLHLEEGTDGLTHRREAINVQVPTEDLVLTPPVPSRGPPQSAVAGALGMCEAARYLYAIDATDGSVLAVDISSETSPSFGAVLPVSTGSGSSDRIAFGLTRVRTLEVVTPGYELGESPCVGAMCGPGGEDDEAEPGPGLLRGVFLAAGASDGTLRIVDVADLDAPCRPSDPDLADDSAPCTEADQDVGIFLQRHRPRLDSTMRTVVELTGLPSFSFDGVPSPVLLSGDVEAGEAPGLTPLEGGCPGDMLQVFGPDPGDPALLCATADPYTSFAQSWTATWEGGIPGTQGGRGRFGEGDELLASGADFCARGALGRVPDDEEEEGEEDEPEEGYPGDALVITSPLPDGKELEDGSCEPFRVEEDEELPDIAFAIRRAEELDDGTGRLVLGDRLGDFDLDSVKRCYDELVGYEVRVRDRYRVAGSSSGFLHRVVVGDGGVCEVDYTKSERLVGRARPTERYVNPFVAFQIRAFSTEDLDGDDEPDNIGLPPGSTGALELDLGRTPPPLFLDLCPPDSRSGCVTALPTTLRFNEIDERLYVVDIAERGLVGIQLDPVLPAQAFD